MFAKAFDKILAFALLGAVLWIAFSALASVAHKADNYMTDKTNQYISQPLLKKSSY